MRRQLVGVLVRKVAGNKPIDLIALDSLKGELVDPHEVPFVARLEKPDCPLKTEETIAYNLMLAHLRELKGPCKNPSRRRPQRCRVPTI